MSKFVLFLTFLLAVGGLSLGSLAFYQSWLDQPLDAAPDLGPVEIGDVAGVAAAPGDVTFDLQSRDEGGNTELLWHCGKVLGGIRSDYAGAFTKLSGRLLVDPRARALRAGELHVAVGAMRGHGEHPAPNALINTVRADRWFLLDEHPTAILRIAEVVPATESTSERTHVLRGTFELNGLERPIEIPARLDVGEDRVAIDAEFPISRATFAVAARRGIEPPAEVDDEIRLEVHVRASPDAKAVIAELNRSLVAQQAQTGELAQRVSTLTGRLDRAEAAIDEVRRQIEKVAARPAAGGGGVDVASLPARFVDHVDYTNEKNDERLKDLGFQAEFEMVLVPGDPARGIDPFYVETTEVTWKMFRAWSYCEDVADKQYAAELKENLLRPSPCYDDASRGHGFEGRAALGVSRRNALAFCRHVSEQTGRPYRLWTDAEWRYVAEAQGGVPEDPEKVAWLLTNSDTDDFGDPLSMPVGKKPASSLGLHDFWGNVAEWVMADDKFIRGGSYLCRPEELSLDWREDESQDIWNMTYPNTPKSLWWYRDRFDMGFRLVCDPINIPNGG